VNDIAWCPDNYHLASCSTDSRINIWDINQQNTPIHTIEQHASGMTWDPFGKFFAIQSAETLKTVVYRVQDFKNIIKEKELTDFYGECGRGAFRRISWSPDGALVATCAAKANKTYLAPLISRSNWNFTAFLGGHHRQVSAARFNRVLYKHEI